MRFLAFVPAILAVGLGTASAQIVNDPNADTRVSNPAFPQNSGPVVAVDSGHNNYHTIDNRFKPFAELLLHDGFRVRDSKSGFTEANLSAVNVLVISNARGTSSPEASAFSEPEIAMLKNWVARGGSLLLIADHHPFAGSAHDLALAFGFQFQSGVVGRDPIGAPPDIFTIESGTLQKDVVTNGRGPDEAITSLRTFTGSAFRAPPNARPLIVFPAGFMIHQCGLPCPAGVPESNAAGYLQGAVLKFGKGRIAVFGEAAMFSAQVAMGPTPYYFGFDAPDAKQNKPFILNLMHWLAGLLPD
jgi:hypothetical protein